ncbi:MAG TPA: AbrB/MazE/SpoVT family DNA-binding domain-containing protein [Casimicrobiaceae bacterium]|nr:AbrB/MazE/SpoVT family DNA-binding domain-containing protein [Casimicrobiaceae bacterium]
MKINIRRIGNSQGIVIPKPLLAQAGLDDEAEITVEGNAIILRKPVRAVRAGWAEAARRIAQANDDHLVTTEFSNAEDAENVW